jgi:hypothetical protein
MENEIYETDKLTNVFKNLFKNFLDKEIGTDYEINEHPDSDGSYYIIIFDLTESEVELIRKFESSLDNL